MTFSSQRAAASPLRGVVLSQTGRSDALADLLFTQLCMARQNNPKNQRMNMFPPFSPVALLQRGSLRCLALLVALGLGAGSHVKGEEGNRMTVKQTFTITNVPAGAKQIRGWLWMPEDRPGQRVLEFRVTKAPENFRITRDPRYGRSWIYVEAAALEKGIAAPISMPSSSHSAVRRASLAV